VYRTTAVVLAALVLAVAALGWSATVCLESAMPRVAALDPNSAAIRDAAAQAGAENVLVLVTDTTAPSGTGTDTAVVAHVPSEGSGLVALALPGDLEITRPPCERWDAATAAYLDQTVPAEARTALQSAYTVGGPRCATRAVQQLTGLAVTRFVAVDATGVARMVDAVGGVEVCNERPVLDAALGPVVPAAGAGTLRGTEAGDLLRADDVAGEAVSGYDRVERQQRVLTAVLDETLSPGTLLDPGALRSLSDALATSTAADGIGLRQLLALTGSLQRLDAAGVTFVGAPTAAQRNQRGHRVLREAEAAALFTAVREDAPLPPQDDPRAVAPGLAPDEVTVDVLNASGRDGLARRVGQTLTELGFQVDAVGNTDQATTTVVRHSPELTEAAALLAATVPAAGLQPGPDGSTGVLELVLGTGFDEVVRSPEQPAAAPVAAVDCT
jgi:LCP family protein required for cell wall assembly